MNDEPHLTGTMKDFTTFCEAVNNKPLTWSELEIISANFKPYYTHYTRIKPSLCNPLMKLQLNSTYGKFGIPSGIELIASPYLPERRIEHVKLTWKQRLLSSPWKPWVKSVMVDKGPYIVHSVDTIFGHPNTIKKLKETQV